ncbi:hypothetical protein ACJJTC_007092 [Scirpophaga incertulas]
MITASGGQTAPQLSTASYNFAQHHLRKLHFSLGLTSLASSSLLSLRKSSLEYSLALVNKAGGSLGLIAPDVAAPMPSAARREIKTSTVLTKIALGTSLARQTLQVKRVLREL